MFTLALIILTVRFMKRIPGSIVGLLAGTIAARFLGWHVETIGTRFGGIPVGLPHFAWPEFKPELVPGLMAPGGDHRDAGRD